MTYLVRGTMSHANVNRKQGVYIKMEEKEAFYSLSIYEDLILVFI